MLEEMEMIKTDHLIGFDRVAKDLQQKLMKIGRKKGYSSFSLICAGGKESEKGNYSGGMIGDVGAIIEGLFYMAQKQPHVKELLILTVSALQEQERIDNPQKVEIARLHDEGVMKPRLFNALSDKGIITLEQLQEHQEGDVANWDRIGAGSMKELKQIMTERGLKFKGCETASKLKVVK